MQTLDIEVLLGILVFIANTYLGILVFLRNRDSWTNRLYLLLTVFIDAYVITNFLSLHPEVIGSTDQLFWIRVVMFVCSFIGPTLFLLLYTFPGERLEMKRKYLFLLLLLMFTSATLSLSPYVFSDLQFPEGKPVPTPGPAIPIFFIDFIGLFIASFLLLGIKLKHSVGVVKSQLQTITYGVIFSFSLMGLSTVIFVVILKSSSFVFLGPIYTVFLMTAIAYAIIKYNLFKIKMIASQAFVSIIAILFFTRIFIGKEENRTIDIITFLGTILFGVLLIRSVKQEIKSTEEIAELAKRLTETNWQLAKTNEQLRIIDQRKSEFVSIVSHQLRTPITAIKGYASLLLEGTFGKLASKEQENSIDKIFISSKRLADMVNDFLDISKIEQGTMTYTLNAVDLKVLISDLIGEFTPTADAHGITLDFHFTENELFMVNADEGKIRQIISNLIDNGIKYTKKGTTLVSLEKNHEKGTVVCRVKDTGIGLSQDDIHHLFGKFTRGIDGQRQNTEGSGLGLYVAKKMLEAQSGKIWVDSEGPGKGSTFAIELPELKKS